MDTRGCSTPPRPRNARRLRTATPASIASSNPGKVRSGCSGNTASAGSNSASNTARAWPSSPDHSRRAPGSSGVLARASAAWMRAARASAGVAASAATKSSSGVKQAAIWSMKARAPSDRAIVRSPSTPSGGAGPRRPSRSSPRAASRQEAGVRVAAASGCFSSDSSGTGRKPSATAWASRRRNTAGGVAARGSPALSSATMPNRPSSTATLPARSRSGVTSATRRSGVCNAPRRMRAMAKASSCWSAGARRDSPAGSAVNGSRHVPRALAGSRARCSTAVRLGGAAAAAGCGWTSPRRASSPFSSRRRPDCGWLSSSASHEASGSARSRPGSTTCPRGSPATTRNSRATAGMPPVEPAAKIRPAGAVCCQARACASSNCTCRAAGFISPCSDSQSGQARVTMVRNVSVMPQCWA